MAITLSGSVSASETNMRLSAALTATPGELFRLEDEMVEFGGYNLVNRLRDRKQVSFRRGVGGTTAVTHANGTTLLRVADAVASSADAESSADPFSVGGVQTIRLLGPFRVAHNTAGINSQISVATLAADTVVIRAFARIITSFTDTGQGLLQIGAGGLTAVSEGNYQTCIDYSMATTQEDSGSWVEPGDVAVNGVVALKEAGHLVVHISSGEATGVADIYALIAEPA